MSAALAKLAASVSLTSIATFIAQPARPADIIPFPTKREVVVDRAELAAAVESVAAVIERRNTIPILSNLRVRGTGNSLELIGTDLDIEISVRVPSRAPRTIDTTVSVDLLRAFLKKGKSADVSLRQDEDSAHIDLGKVSYDIQSLPSSDFPELSAPVEASVFTMSGADFLDGIASTMGAISREQTRYYLNGIFMHVDSDSDLQFVATDGHRLYLQSFRSPEMSKTFPEIIIPAKTVAVLYKLMKGKNNPDTVTISASSARIRLEWDGYCVTSKLIDGTFPDYRRVIPGYNDKLAVVSVDDMKEAIDSVSVVSSERGRAVKLSFSENKVDLVVNNPDTGRARAEIDASYNCDALDIGFNSKYLTDILSHCGEVVEFKLADSGAPTLFTTDKTGWKAVLMPMRV